MGWKLWKTEAQKLVNETEVYLVFGVTSVDEVFRSHTLLESYSLKRGQVKNESALLVSPLDALNYDYILVCREDVAKRNGWLK